MVAKNPLSQLLALNAVNLIVLVILLKKGKYCHFCSQTPWQ